jgi:hypothetical protein
VNYKDRLLLLLFLWVIFEGNVCGVSLKIIILNIILHGIKETVKT